MIFNVKRKKIFWRFLILSFVFSFFFVPVSYSKQIPQIDIQSLKHEALKIFFFPGSHSKQIPQISIQYLKHEAPKRLSRVKEVEELRNLARKLGIQRVFFFGRTAASYLHYVYRNLEQEKGFDIYNPTSFDYHFVSIFRYPLSWDQGIEIVIDTEDESLAREFEKKVLQHFPYFQGNRSWKVKLLGKEILREDFLKGNTDSHSIGLIEITESNIGKGKRIFDVRSGSKIQLLQAVHQKIIHYYYKITFDARSESHFLQAVHQKIVHYYYNSLQHKQTKRYLNGNNPEIFSVINLLINAFQFNLKIRQEDLLNIKKVISEFNIESDIRNDNVRTWIENNGKKLYKNAFDLEYAYNTMNQLGLLELLKSIDSNNLNKEGSLSWWMNKMPLLSFPLGGQKEEKNRVTAKDLKIDYIAHQFMHQIQSTNSFLEFLENYTSMTINPYSLNAFISTGKRAKYGEGFYAFVVNNKVDLVNNTPILKIFLRLKPEAVEGEDFIFYRSQDPITHKQNPDPNRVLIINKQAVDVISPMTDYRHFIKNPVIYFEELSKPNSVGVETSFDRESGKAIFNQKLNIAIIGLKGEDQQRIIDLLEKALREKNPLIHNELRESYWNDYSFHLIEKLIQNDEVALILAKYVVGGQIYPSKYFPPPHLLKMTRMLLEKNNLEIDLALIQYAIRMYVRGLIDLNNGDLLPLHSYLLEIVKEPVKILVMRNNPKVDFSLITNMFSSDFLWINNDYHPFLMEIIELFVKRNNPEVVVALIENVFKTESSWWLHGDNNLYSFLMQQTIVLAKRENPEVNVALIENVFPIDFFWINNVFHPFLMEIVELFVKMNNPEVNVALIENVFKTESSWWLHRDNNLHSFLMQQTRIFVKRNNPEVDVALIENAFMFANRVISEALDDSNSNNETRSEFIKIMNLLAELKSPEINEYLYGFVTNKFFYKPNRLLQTLIRESSEALDLILIQIGLHELSTANNDRKFLALYFDELLKAIGSKNNKGPKNLDLIQFIKGLSELYLFTSLQKTHPELKVRLEEVIIIKSKEENNLELNQVLRDKNKGELKPSNCSHLFS